MKVCGLRVGKSFDSTGAGVAPCSLRGIPGFQEAPEGLTVKGGAGAGRFAQDHDPSDLFGSMYPHNMKAMSLATSRKDVAVGPCSLTCVSTVSAVIRRGDSDTAPR